MTRQGPSLGSRMRSLVVVDRVSISEWLRVIQRGRSTKLFLVLFSILGGDD
jgi:hypothetical protein